jgi:tetraacyldisaccharide 4'-kinase
MKQLRFLLFPFAALYSLITGIRNFLYNQGVFKSYTAPVPTIVVGNLSVGGTGKSPQIEYLIRLLADKYGIATLSRGYKRQSEGFVLANENTKVKDLGDEPFQFFSKFKNIRVSVDANRIHGIQQLLQLENSPEVILLDDAYQHRKVKASCYILLTAYNDLYCDDFVLPVGNLRESKTGAKRAKAVIVTKCPPTLSDSEKEKIKTKLKLESHQKLFFTTIRF